jgi:hypothetical protein
MPDAGMGCLWGCICREPVVRDWVGGDEFQILDAIIRDEGGAAFLSTGNSAT